MRTDHIGTMKDMPIQQHTLQSGTVQKREQEGEML